MSLNSLDKPDSEVKQFHFLLADDDADDRFFFEKATRRLIPETKVSFVADGEKLIEFLRTSNTDELPDVLFLDLNMPRMNGSECLKQIRGNYNYDSMPVIIYSTGSHETVADILYKNGAQHYVRKPDFAALSKVLQHVLNLLINRTLNQPGREQFVLKLA